MYVYMYIIYTFFFLFIFPVSLPRSSVLLLRPVRPFGGGSKSHESTRPPLPVLRRRDTVMTFKKQREPAKHRPGVFLLFCATHFVQGEV